MTLILAGGSLFATHARQSPEPCIPPGEFSPTLPGEIRSARELFRRIDGNASIHVSAFEFDAPDSASAALPLIVDETADSFERFWKGDLKLSETSARALGDESLVLSGMVTSDDGKANAAVVLAIVRSGNLVWFGEGTALDDIYVLEDVMATLEAVVGRSPTNTATLVDGRWTGGAFAMLPQLPDMPEGYKVVGVC